ncbi:MAG: exodeoxyribonuclease V subunit alpha [Acidimicrobiales bacterium]|jgi:exodeoxyribonuclease V alpha subunit
MTTVAGRPDGWSTDAVEAALRAYTEAGVLGRFEVQLANAVCRSAPTVPSDDTLVALALAARATRLGHVCLDLEAVHEQVVASQDDEGHMSGLALPDPGPWRAELARSAIVADGGSLEPDPTHATAVRPLVLDGRRLYLQRYWSFEVAVAGELGARSALPIGSAASDGDVDAALDAVFPPTERGPDGADLQRLAARRALTYPVTVIAGGPGTGKTHTVARILAAGHRMAAGRGVAFRAALAAPTGKAAARMKEAVDDRIREMSGDGSIDAAEAGVLTADEPTTIHRLLGYESRTRFRHDRSDPLPHDMVVIDETSMVSLPLLARLLAAVRPDARLVLVGDPFQLSSIEAGTVMGDMVGPGRPVSRAGDAPLDGRVTELREGHRFAEGSAIGELALAIRDGDGDEVVRRLSAGGAEVHWIRPGDARGLEALRRMVDESAGQVVAAALAGSAEEALAAAQRVKVLAAVRRGPFGLDDWTVRIAAGVHDAVPPDLRGGRPRVGTPVMVTRNDAVNRLANGDVGVVVREADGRRVAMRGPDGTRVVAPTRLGEWEPWWAMTIHKSQGSEFPHAVVSLPTTDSPILTRELLYTAVTRGKPEVTVVGSEEMVRVAVSRPVARASGLADRLWPGG